MKVVLIGAGNVAHHLGLLMRKSGHEIIQLYNRSKASGNILASLLQCEFTNSISKISHEADIYIIALKDDAIAGFCTKLNFNPSFILHTSGTCSIDIFPPSFNCGALYPVQTFSKNIARTPETIPFCIETRKKSSLPQLRKFVQSLSSICYVKSSAERQKIHLSAVIVNNFTNHLFTLSANYLSGENLAFDILRPLILETANKVQSGKPSAMQTGPARRGDKTIIKEHLKLLRDYPEMKKIYELLSTSISKTYST